MLEDLSSRSISLASNCMILALYQQTRNPNIMSLQTLNTRMLGIMLSILIQTTRLWFGEAVAKKLSLNQRRVEEVLDFSPFIIMGITFVLTKAPWQVTMLMVGLLGQAHLSIHWSALSKACTNSLMTFIEEKQMNQIRKAATVILNCLLLVLYRQTRNLNVISKNALNERIFSIITSLSLQLLRSYVPGQERVFDLLSLTVMGYTFYMTGLPWQVSMFAAGLFGLSHSNIYWACPAKKELISCPTSPRTPHKAISQKEAGLEKTARDLKTQVVELSLKLKRAQYGLGEQQEQVASLEKKLAKATLIYRQMNQAYKGLLINFKKLKKEKWLLAIEKDKLKGIIRKKEKINTHSIKKLREIERVLQLTSCQIIDHFNAKIKELSLKLEITQTNMQKLHWQHLRQRKTLENRLIQVARSKEELIREKSLLVDQQSGLRAQIKKLSSDLEAAQVDRREKQKQYLEQQAMLKSELNRVRQSEEVLGEARSDLKNQGDVLRAQLNDKEDKILELIEELQVYNLIFKKADRCLSSFPKSLEEEIDSESFPGKHLVSGIQSLVQENECLRTQIEKAQLEQVKHEITEHCTSNVQQQQQYEQSEQVKLLQHELNLANQENEELLDVLSQLENQIRLLKRQQDDLKVQLGHQDQVISVLCFKFLSATSLTRDRNVEILMFKEKIETKDEEYALLKEELSQSEKEYALLKAKFSQSEEERFNLLETVKGLLEKADRLSALNSQLEMELAELLDQRNVAFIKARDAESEKIDYEIATESEAIRQKERIEMLEDMVSVLEGIVEEKENVQIKSRKT